MVLQELISEIIPNEMSYGHGSYCHQSWSCGCLFRLCDMLKLLANALHHITLLLSAKAE